VLFRSRRSAFAPQRFARTRLFCGNNDQVHPFGSLAGDVASTTTTSSTTTPTTSTHPHTTNLHLHGSSIAIGTVHKNIEGLLKANEKWRQDVREHDPLLFSDTGARHKPEVLWIGCSDARVPANVIVGEPPGTMFVHRNIANQVISTDFNAMSVLQYAVEVLDVKHIIVCGHYDCGGVKASLERFDHHAPLEHWLTNIRHVHRFHKDELDAITDPVQKTRRLVELNVIEQCLNVFHNPTVQRRRSLFDPYLPSPSTSSDSSASLASATTPATSASEATPTPTPPGPPNVTSSSAENTTTTPTPQRRDKRYHWAHPRIHALVYDPSDGQLTRLPMNFNEYIQSLKNVYGLTDRVNPAAMGGGPKHDLLKVNACPSS